MESWITVFSLVLSVIATFLVLVMIAYATRIYFLIAVGWRTPRVPDDTKYTPFLSILIPGHNEGMVIGRTISRLLELDYPRDRLEIIIVNDASTDNTAEILDSYVLQGYIKAIHRRRAPKPGGAGDEAFVYTQNGKFRREVSPLPGGGGRGKSAALNAAFKHIDPRSEAIILFDADHYPERTSILHDFARHLRDPNVCIVQGDVRTINADTNLLTRFVAAERDGANIDQNGRGVLNLVAQHSGTVAAIRVVFLHSIGGWDENALCDDTDITFAAMLRGYRIAYDPTIVSWEEGVDNLPAYWKQRTRWARGHMRVFFKYWWRILTSHRLEPRQKVDGFLLLAYYFVPLCVGLSAILNLLYVLGIHFETPFWDSAGLLISIYCTPALFLEIAIGLLYRRVNLRRYLTLLMLPFFSLLNVVICCRALYMEIFGIHKNVWIKTQRSGKVMKELTVNITDGVASRRAA